MLPAEELLAVPDPDPGPGPDRVTLVVTSEKVAGEGEDADPLLLTDGAAALLAVCDGLGGGGARRYVSAREPGVVRKGAYLASRRVRHDLLEILGGPDRDLPDGGWLGDALRGGLHRLGDDWTSASRIVSPQVGRFPTTLALGRVHHGATETVVDLRWCGDSRVYALDPEAGLQQLTRDHVADHAGDDLGRGGDAPMSRRVTADEAPVESWRVALPPDAVVLAATDGCFAYWPSAVHFEHALLGALGAATDAEDWQARLQAAIAEVAADDATLAMVGPPGMGFDALRDAMGPRSRHVARLVADVGTDDLDYLWRRYAIEHLSRVPPPVPEEMPPPRVVEPVDDGAEPAETADPAFVGPPAPIIEED